tara:strand:+ start:4794 stop:5444 length:651 start_codon:yes stop_codon:yes gene_type:complete
MYKIQRNPFDGLENTIIRKSDGAFIPRDTDNSDYLRFVNDIYTNGVGIVEGADYVGVTTYTEARAAEYPPIVDQLDKIYHSGIDAWKADIKVIKDKYPKTQVGITSIAPIPDWVNTALFDKQKEEYVKATARLARYELSAGVKGVIRTEKVWDNEKNSHVDRDVIGYVIEPLPIVVLGTNQINVRNPLVVQDEAEREAAQEVINKTPQAVIDSINT